MNFQCLMPRYVTRPNWKHWRCHSICHLTLQHTGQYWHWNGGSFPHSYIRYLLSESFHLYFRPQLVHRHCALYWYGSLLPNIRHDPESVKSRSCCDSTCPVNHQRVLFNSAMPIWFGETDSWAFISIKFLISSSQIRASYFSCRSLHMTKCHDSMCNTNIIFMDQIIQSS
jgi:hypothetical protein